MLTEELRRDVSQALEESGLTQRQFALKCGLSHSWLNKFLTGYTDNPKANTIVVLQRQCRRILSSVRAA